MTALLDGKAGEPVPATPAATDKRGTPALHFAAAGDRVPVLEVLWSRGADAEAEDRTGRTALHFAAAGRAPAAASFLASKAGAWVGAPGPGDDSPLHLAARAGDGPTVGALLARASAADLRDRNARGLTPLGEALLSAAAGSSGTAAGAAAAALLTASAVVGAVDVPASDGWTLLHLCAAADRAAAVDLLLGKGGLDARTGRAKKDKEEEADATTAAPSSSLLTPLHAAALGGSVAVVKALLAAGADAAALDGDGRPPADLAGASAEVREVLAMAAAAAAVKATSAAATTATPPPATPASSPLTPQAAAFVALPHPARLTRARQWAACDADADLDAATAGLPPTVRRLAADARDLRHARAITTAIAALHDDDDFQDGARLGRVRDAVAAVRADPRAAPRYAGDLEAMAVLVGLRRLQGVCAANGRLAVPFERLVVPAGRAAATRAEDAATLADLAALLDRHAAALVAAAGEADEAGASAAAAAVLGDAAARPQQQQGEAKEEGRAAAVVKAGAPAAVPVEAVPAQPPAPQAKEAPASPTAPAARSPPSSPPPPALEAGDPSTLSTPLTPGAPDPDANPWASMRRDLPRALAGSAARSLAAVLISWMVMWAMDAWGRWRGGRGPAT